MMDLTRGLTRECVALREAREGSAVLTPLPFPKVIRRYFQESWHRSRNQSVVDLSVMQCRFLVEWSCLPSRLRRRPRMRNWWRARAGAGVCVVRLDRGGGESSRARGRGRARRVRTRRATSGCRGCFGPTGFCLRIRCFRGRRLPSWPARQESRSWSDGPYCTSPASAVLTRDTPVTGPAGRHLGDAPLTAIHAVRYARNSHSIGER